MVASLLKMAALGDWPVPDYSTLCRRQSTVTIRIPFRRSDSNLNLLVDSTGMKMLGNGEWQVRKHGPGRRQWRKVHLAMDTAPGTSVRSSSHQAAKATAPCCQTFSSTSHRTSRSALSRRTEPTIPASVTRPSPMGAPQRSSRSAATAVAGQEGCPAARGRNETLRASRRFGWALRKRLTGYHARSRIEAQMRRLKAFGERIASQDPDRQAAEIHTRIALMNRFSALGRAEIMRVA
jgi:hypothetical protein